MSNNTCVWFEIPVSDIQKGRDYYSAVLGRDLVVLDGEPNPMVPLTKMDDDGVSGHLYPGSAATDGNGSTLHIAAPASLDETADRVRKAGGEVISDPIEIPFGAFIYTKDPDGNSIGFFAPAG